MIFHDCLVVLAIDGKDNAKVNFLRKTQSGRTRTHYFLWRQRGSAGLYVADLEQQYLGCDYFSTVGIL